jgi:hypothetical protein
LGAPDQPGASENQPHEKVAFPDRRGYGCTTCDSVNHTAGAIWCPLKDDTEPVASASAALEQAVAQAIAWSFWKMMGGGSADDGDPAPAPSAGDMQLAYDVLAMPEMQAVRLVLTDAMVVLGYDDDPLKQQSKIAKLEESWDDLPASVAQWVTT